MHLDSDIKSGAFFNGGVFLMAGTVDVIEHALFYNVKSAKKFLIKIYSYIST
jgi:hypothetical protein